MWLGYVRPIMMIVLSAVLASLVLGAGLLVAMFVRRDGFLGLLGLVSMHLAGVLGAVFAALGSEL